MIENVLKNTERLKEMKIKRKESKTSVVDDKA